MSPLAGRPDPRAPTFRGRLTASMSVLSVIVLALASVAIYLWARAALVDAFDRALLTVAQAEVASAVDMDGGPVHLHEGPPLRVPGAARGYGRVMRLWSADRAVDISSAGLESGPQLAADAEREARAFAGRASVGDLRRGDEVYRAVYYPFDGPAGHRLVALVAIPRAPLDRTLLSLLGALAACLLVGGGAAAWGANRLARRLTRPLERIADSARAIGGPSLAARIPDVSRDVELREVTGILNEMLARLEAAFEAQRRFLADASHELRSPLANIRGTIEVALRRPRATEEYRGTLEAVLPEIERLSRLVHDLLRLSRAEAGRLSLALAPCRLDILAAEAVKALGARAGDRDVRLTLDAPGPVRVRGDADRLREVLDNLLDNALRYAPPQTEVLVRVEQAGDRVRLAVTDAGPGLAPDEQALVFERFFRADRSRARDSGGIGLGLPIARALVEAHGGHLGVRSAPGHGATFALELPVADEDGAA